MYLYFEPDKSSIQPKIQYEVITRFVLERRCTSGHFWSEIGQAATDHRVSFNERETLQICTVKNGLKWLLTFPMLIVRQIYESVSIDKINVLRGYTYHGKCTL